MKYVVIPNHKMDNSRAFCGYTSENKCTGSGGHGGGNYVNVDVGV